ASGATWRGARRAKHGTRPSCRRRVRSPRYATSRNQALGAGTSRGGANSPGSPAILDQIFPKWSVCLTSGNYLLPRPSLEKTYPRTLSAGSYSFSNLLRLSYTSQTFIDIHLRPVVHQQLNALLIDSGGATDAWADGIGKARSLSPPQRARAAGATGPSDLPVGFFRDPGLEIRVNVRSPKTHLSAGSRANLRYVKHSESAPAAQGLRCDAEQFGDGLHVEKLIVVHAGQDAARVLVSGPPEGTTPAEITPRRPR